MVAYVDGNEPPPPVLTFFLRYGYGNPDTTPHRIAHRATIAGNVYGAMRRLREAKGEQITKLSSHDLAIIAYLRDTGLLP